MITNQLLLFDLPVVVNDHIKTIIDRWSWYKFEPLPGVLTYLPIISKLLDGSGTLYTCFQIGYVHRVDGDKITVFMPELWQEKWQVYKDTWLLLNRYECDPVMRFGFDEAKFRIERPNKEFSIRKLELTA